MDQVMDGRIIGFIIWSLCGGLMIGMGIFSLFLQKPMNFWANVNMGEVTSVRKYNNAMGKLYSLYGVVFIILGLPLLSEQNSAWILLSVAGVMIESIGAMMIYSLIIEKKYKVGRKQNEKV